MYRLLFLAFSLNFSLTFLLQTLSHLSRTFLHLSGLPLSFLQFQSLLLFVGLFFIQYFHHIFRNFNFFCRNFFFFSFLILFIFYFYIGCETPTWRVQIILLLLLLIDWCSENQNRTIFVFFMIFLPFAC